MPIEYAAILKAVKMINLDKKNNLIFAQSIYRGSEAVIPRTRGLFFRAKIRKIVNPSFTLQKWG